MKSSTLLIISAILIGLCGPVFAGPAGEQYSLDQFYRSALAKAEQIGVSKEAVAIARYTRKQALSVLIPTFTAFGDYTNYGDKKVMEDTIIRQEWDSSYGVSIGQSITLNGRELTALRIAEDGIEKSTFDLDATKESYLFNVATAFFDVAKTQQAILIAKANVARLQTYKNAVATRLSIGEVSKTELFRTEAELASADAHLIEAENMHKLARTFLARLTGLALPFEIVEPEITLDNLNTTELNELKKNAVNNRAELKSFALEAAIAEKQIKWSKGAFWPRLSVEGIWARLDQEPEPEYMPNENTSIGANITMDIFDGGLRSAQVSEARAQQKQAQLSFEDATRNVHIEVEQAYRNWQTQQGIIASLESQLRYAKENYSAFTHLFENGMANSVDIMDANTTLLTAERQLSEARYNLQLSILDLERTSGIFLTTIEGRIGQ